ncbi:PREDICTED: pleckstrin homology domain-containing family G member 3 [Elephantulus edwardii]|uniref:pleckstrin homology domain-containing family G member 3 n=1 Tax=Elephantulus edwardii TaxID=28737 RepID=UPI0003F0D5A1|nr:PREDICTED: pleckstrin homology domain-containing family G member 3 [Elephantulus edwardii]
MPVSASLHQDGSQERPVSVTSTSSSSGSSQDSRDTMEEPNGSEALAENGAGSPKSQQAPNNNNNSSSTLTRNGPLSPLNNLASSGHELSYVGRVVREIVETERMYVQDLRSIVESQEFDIYTQYCNNYPNSVAALTECMRDKQQAKFFRDRQELLQHSLPLGSYLLKPVQRILKYHLLLQEIAKHFDEEEEGFEVVEDAIDTMTGVAWYINDMKRRHEHAVRLQEIQSLLINWKGPDLTIYGELVLEGTFRVHRVRNERTFFLFDKALLITKKRGDHFVYKGHIPCSSLMLIESTRDSLFFTITHYKHSKQQYIIQAKTMGEKRNWTHHIKRLILENHHTTIPQKAKEAILEMDSYYPSQYRYSSERLKKAWSSHNEVSTHVRQGRRQSEPSRHLLRQLSEKGKHTGMKGKGRRECEGSKSYRRPGSRSPGSPEKHMSFESISSLPEAEPDPDPGAEQEVFTAMEGPSTEEMPSDAESPEVPEIHPEVDQDLPEMDHVGDMVDFVVAESTEDLKALSSEEEEEDIAAAQDPESLLPPSVLDQAGVIAERFVSSFSRRSSLAVEDGKSSGLTSPRLARRSSSVLSLEGSEKGPARSGSITDSLSSQLPPDADVRKGGPADSSPSINGTEPSSPGCPVDPDWTRSKKEPLLSTRDRLLLDKIKSYYENAEHHDAGFSIRRRESLSYIPKGLVKNSVSRFNNLPPPDPEPVALLGPKRQAGSQSSSCALFDLPGSSQASTENPVPITDAEFRPSLEILKLWEDIESAVRSPPKGQGQANGFDLHEPLFILEEHELGAITEESAMASPESVSPTEQSSQAQLARELKELVKELSSSSSLGELVTPLHPSFVQLSHMMDSHVNERVKNKVYQLARQYSLRIKSSKPVMARPPLYWKKAASERNGKSSTIPCLQEEAGEPLGGKGKRRPKLSLFNDEQMNVQEHCLHKPCSARETSPWRFTSSSLAAGPKTTSPGVQSSIRSPLSPFGTRTFNWPDVRVLRSKYASRDEAPTTEGSRAHHLPVNRSRSVPENMMEPPLSGRVSHCCSLTSKRGQGAGATAQPQPPGSPPRAPGSPPRVPGSPPQAGLDGNEDLYVTADLILENHQRVIVMEKGPGPEGLDEKGNSQGLSLRAAGVGQGQKDVQESGDYQLRDEGPREPVDPSHQGRVRNLREKFQALNSIG